MSIATRAGRRRWVVRVALAASLAGVGLVACFDPTAPAGGISAESSSEGVPAHTHRATIPMSDVESPPSGGATYATATSAGHAHTVTLTRTQLTDLQQHGAAVSLLTTGGPGDHQHGFNFAR
jgi:hypothetical protein